MIYAKYTTMREFSFFKRDWGKKNAFGDWHSSADLISMCQRAIA